MTVDISCVFASRVVFLDIVPKKIVADRNIKKVKELPLSEKRDYNIL